MLDSFNIKFIVSIFLLMVFPLSSAYHEALRSAQLPEKQHVILGLAAILTTVISFNVSIILIGQIDVNSFSVFSLLPVFILFFIGRIIRKKFPELFSKTLLRKQG